jgi:hypothetical protein
MARPRYSEGEKMIEIEEKKYPETEKDCSLILCVGCGWEKIECGEVVEILEAYKKINIKRKRADMTPLNPLEMIIAMIGKSG